MYPEHEGIDKPQNMLNLKRKPILSREINLSENTYGECMKLKTWQTRIANSDFFEIPELRVPICSS
jgi:hypothetical protein